MTNGNAASEDIPEWVAYNDVPPPPMLWDVPDEPRAQTEPRPLFVLLGGRIGSGRSWFLSPRGPVDPNSAVVLDVAAFLDRLPARAGRTDAQSYQEAHALFLEAEATARASRRNVVVKSTMRVRDEAEAWVYLYREAGYRTCGYYMYASPNVAARRALNSATASGKRICHPSKEFLLRCRSNEAAFDAIRPVLDSWALYENMGAAPTLVAREPH